MSRLSKILCLAISMVFILISGASAIMWDPTTDPIPTQLNVADFAYDNAFTYDNADGSLGAVVFFGLEPDAEPGGNDLGDGPWVYTYQVLNVNFKTDAGTSTFIRQFVLPVTTEDPPGYDAISGITVGTEPNVLTTVFEDTLDNELQFDFVASMLNPNSNFLQPFELLGLNPALKGLSLSQTVSFTSDIPYDFEMADLTNGQTENIMVLTNVDIDTGGDITVPEPGTLLLLGIGLLGLGTSRYQKSRRKR